MSLLAARRGRITHNPVERVTVIDEPLKNRIF